VTPATSSSQVAPAPVQHAPAPLDLGQASELPAGAFAPDKAAHEAAPAPHAEPQQNAPHQGGLPLGADSEKSLLLRKPVRPDEAEVAAAPTADELLLDEETGGAPAALPRFARTAATDAGDARAPKSAGSTLFERMANLRGGPREADPEDDDPEGGASLNIPRFLGRQNNQ
jgi:cell division protein FtsZ